MSDQYSITVTIEQKTLDVLKKDPEIVLVLVKDVKSQGDLKNGNVVFATYGSQDLSPKQSFTWEESYAVSETTQGFEVGVFILCLMHTIDDGHVVRCQSRVGHANGKHPARPDSHH